MHESPTSSVSGRPTDSELAAASATVVGSVDDAFVPRQSPFVWSGYLMPAGSDNEPPFPFEGDVTEIHSGIYRIGRIPTADLVLESSDVSRDHARVHRHETTFYLEDRLSTHGTYVNGDRVLWCRLCNGDLLQFGVNSKGDSSWYFDRAAIRQSKPSKTIQNSRYSRPADVPKDQLVVTFWGCRGSIPTSGSHTETYGGNTTCVEVRYRDALFILDAGTGIRALGDAWAREFGESELQATLLFTHLHWDHIQGFPFLKQAYDPRNSIRIVGVDHDTGSVQELLRNQMQGLYFPVPMKAMQAGLSFLNPESEFEIDGVRISTFPLPHPGGAHAYKLTVDTGTFIFATDCELNTLCPNIADIAPTATTGRQFPTDLLEFCCGADLLVIDCQYTDEQYQQRIGWGHNSISTVIDFCRQSRVRTAALTHHDPSATDDDLRRMVACADAALRPVEEGAFAPRVFAAREEMMVAVGDGW